MFLVLAAAFASLSASLPLKAGEVRVAVAREDLPVGLHEGSVCPGEECGAGELSSSRCRGYEPAAIIYNRRLVNQELRL